MNNMILSFFALTSVLSAFFLLYSKLLAGHISLWNVLFLLALSFFYSTFSFAFTHVIARIFRIFLVAFLIFFSWINFAHFKVYNSFVTGGSGFGRLPNFAELSLLLDYWSNVPIWFYLLGILVIIVLVFYEFKLKKETSKYKKILFLFSLGIFMILFAVIKNFDDSDWHLVNRYHTDLGPIGYIGTEIFQKAESEDKVPVDGDIIDVLNRLTVESNNEIIDMPIFDELPNIIFYQLESVPQWVVDLENTPMPFLKQLQKDVISVENFYANDCHTVGAEFTTACSVLTGSSEVIGNRLEPISQECLPNFLSTNFEYKTSVFHANTVDFWNRNKLMPQLGYQNLYFSPLYTPRIYDGIVLDDLLKKQNQSTARDLSYLIGYTSHGPHNQHYIDRNRKESNIEILAYEGSLPDFVKTIEIPEQEIRNYLGFLTSIDNAIEKLFTSLENNGELDNTIVVLYGDHRYYNFKNKDTKHYQLYNEIPFALYVPGIKNKHIPITASHVDIAPSILDVLGIDFDPNQYMGKSIFSDSPHNYALGKCEQEVFYFTNELVIRGNQKTDKYLAEDMKNQIKNVSSEVMELILQSVALSDQLWEYKEDFVLPDKTLVKGINDDNIFIIDDGKRRHIKEEEILLSLGYTWKDVHKFSERILDKYPEGESVQEPESHLMKVTYTVKKDSSILNRISDYPYRHQIAHAMGSSDNISGSNSLEAFKEAYAKGYRIFEMDLAMTKDKKIVLFHENDTMKASDILHEDFMKLKYAEKLTVLDIESLYSIMLQHPDTYFVTDAKEKFVEIHEELVRLSKEKDLALLDRIIPQIYKEEQLQLLRNIYEFPDIIYTLYIVEPSDESVLELLKGQNGITAITERQRRYNEEFNQSLSDLGVGLYVHTINDKQIIDDMIAKDVGVYTDGL